MSNSDINESVCSSSEESVFEESSDSDSETVENEDPVINVFDQSGNIMNLNANKKKRRKIGGKIRGIELF